MTQEQIIEKLKKIGANHNERDAFISNLDLRFDIITNITDFEIIDYDWNSKNMRCWIDTEKSSYLYHFAEQVEVVLSNDVNIALGKFYNYLGDVIFKNAFYDFTDMKVHFVVDNSNSYGGLESTMTLLDAFLWMKDFLIEMLRENNCDWENEHNKRWEEYTEVLKPIFTVIDKIYNLEQVYVLHNK